ncbi:ice-binding family protein [Arthrobacter flavus]|uniref:Ice-binding family protein n=1 Tax=Arthrobacter flavus TaxID=95172 RepID=A0ABW4QBP2_9MICC
MGTTRSHRQSTHFASPPTRAVVGVIAATTAGFMVLVGALTGQPSAFAADAPLLGTAANYSVLAGSTVTNTGNSVLNRRLGLSPGTSVTGFPPGVSAGQDVANATAVQAKSDLGIAYDNAAGEPSTASVAQELGGLTLVEGVYTNATALGLNGALTLDGQNNPNAVFIFQAGSTLTTGSNSSVQFINGAQACNVFWQVGSSATLGTGTAFAGTILALTSISVNGGATIDGRVLAREGAVTLDNNVFTSSPCNVATEGPTATATPTVSASPTVAPTGIPTVTAPPTTAPTAPPTGVPTSTPTAPEPTTAPTAGPTGVPTPTPTAPEPTTAPTAPPTGAPTPTPTAPEPTTAPTTPVPTATETTTAPAPTPTPTETEVGIGTGSGVGGGSGGTGTGSGGTGTGGEAATNRGANIQSAADASSYPAPAVLAGFGAVALALMAVLASVTRRAPRKH